MHVYMYDNNVHIYDLLNTLQQLQYQKHWTMWHVQLATPALLGWASLPKAGNYLFINNQ